MIFKYNDFLSPPNALVFLPYPRVIGKQLFLHFFDISLEISSSLLSSSFLSPPFSFSFPSHTFLSFIYSIFDEKKSSGFLGDHFGHFWRIFWLAKQTRAYSRGRFRLAAVFFAFYLKVKILYLKVKHHAQKAKFVYL